MNKLIVVVLFAGCAVAEPELEGSQSEAALAGGVTLHEVSVPSSVQDAMQEVFGTPPTVRRFTITAPGSTTLDVRVRGALEGLWAQTRRGGDYAVKKYCSKLQPAQTTVAGCAAAIAAGATEPGAFDGHLENWAGDVQANDVATVRAYMASTIASPGEEYDLVVQSGHWEDGEWWLDNTSHRAVVFDASATQVVIVRYYTGSSL
jgi:hypothetical protein